MDAKEIIQHIIDTEKVSPNEFANEIGVSTSVVHGLIKGTTKKITSSTARKINDRYPKYDYNDLVNLSINNSNLSELNRKKIEGDNDYSKKEPSIIKNGVEFTLEEAIFLVCEHHKKALEHKAYMSINNTRAMRALISAWKDDNTIDKEKYFEKLERIDV